MRGMPFQFEQKGLFEIAQGGVFWNNINNKYWSKEEQEELLLYSFANNINNEPTSVLHMRRSPSPPTSASTLSSSFGGGGDTVGGGGGVATVLHPETPAGPTTTTKDEWASELQPIPERCGGLVVGGGGMEDWETMLSETTAVAAASPGGPQDHSLLRWIAGDVVVDDPSFGLKQLLQTGNINNNNSPLDFDGNAGFGVVDFDPSLGYSGSGFVNSSNNNSGNGGGKINVGSSIAPPTSSSGPLNYKVATTTVGFTNNNCNIGQNPILSNGLPLPPGMIYPPQSLDEKPQILNPQMLGQNPSFLLPLIEQPPQQKRHNSGGVIMAAVDPPPAPASQIPKVPFCDPGHEFLMMRKQQQQQQHQHLGNSFVPQGMMMMQFLPKQELQQQQQQQQHALLDQVYKAAELIGTGNFSHAQGILARLNHHLSSPFGKPLHRAAFYFKEALQLLFNNNNINNNSNNTIFPPPPRCPTPFDVIFKMGAYKLFSEISPLIQFLNFTSNQALLEALSDSATIHIVDFDIGFGAQWASFMQELNRGVGGGGGSATPSLKITAFASPSTHHPVELALMRDNLAQFAAEIGVAFDLEVVNFDSLEQTSYSMPVFRAEGEVIAVNFPIWAASNQPAALPNLLRFIKQLSPKIVVSLDRGCDRSDLPFPQHILQALHSYINLLESLDAAVNVTSDAVNKIEKFLLQPKIESTVLGRLRGPVPDKMPLWKTLFASAGFAPVTFSNFAETQAECVVKRTVRGFHVEKRQASLTLCWQRRELVSVSAWRCC
ncbi:hypothetical protein L484_011800 [Morus notabilis]|uniref:Uncharacterized protein n=1 Tax=Morus notabilis TaxID=981085 RepID=W9SUY6_9ROSA|nr:scarecrow-like protein 27 [Morus notabilis]EXC28296.1 hypothetical protein L484_011800 [Morus notabilis]